MVANPARGQLNRENELSRPHSRLRTRSRETGSVVPRQPAQSPHLMVLTSHGIPPDFRGGVHLFIPLTAIGSVPSSSGHAVAYRWRLLPGVRRHRVGIVLKAVPVTGAAFSGFTKRARPSRPAPAQPSFHTHATAYVALTHESFSRFPQRRR